MNKPTNTTKKRYRKTKQEHSPAIQKFAEVFARTNNASEAVRQAFPLEAYTEGSIRTKGMRMLTNVDVILEIEEQKQKMEQIASKALHKVEQLISSDDEQVAGQNSRFMLEQVHGKATQKVEHKGAFVSVTYDLSGGTAPEVPKEILDQLASVQ